MRADRVMGASPMQVVDIPNVYPSSARQRSRLSGRDGFAPDCRYQPMCVVANVGVALVGNWMFRAARFR